MKLTYVNKDFMNTDYIILQDESEGDIIKSVKEKLQFMGERDIIEHTLYAMKKLNHEKDDYLRCVLVKRANGFVIWLYNIESNSFFEGKYIDWFSFEDTQTCQNEAETVFYNRYE